jgi:hypothetical protein
MDGQRISSPQERAADDRFEIRCIMEFRLRVLLSPAAAGSGCFSTCSWGLRRRLYAVACFRRLITNVEFCIEL